MAPNPYITTAVRCAGPNCDKAKGENNHWFVLRRYKRDSGFAVTVWSQSALMRYEDSLPLCGEGCVTKMVASILSSMKTKTEESKTEESK